MPRDERRWTGWTWARSTAWGAPSDDAAQVAAQFSRFEQSLRRQLDNCTLPAAVRGGD